MPKRLLMLLLAGVLVFSLSGTVEAQDDDVDIFDLSLEEFLADGSDLNGDGAIDELDYEAYLASIDELLGDDEDGEDDEEELSLEDFLADGEDLNDDGEIDELDYEEYLAFLDDLDDDEDDEELLSLEEFLAEGEDLNDDGIIDELDYEEFLAFLDDDDFDDEDFDDEDYFEGFLEGVDLERRVLFIDGEEYTAAPGIKLLKEDERPISPSKLIELAGSFPLVEAELNDDGEIVELFVYSFFDEDEFDEGEFDEVEEFFGPVAQATPERIVLAGPRFAITGETRFVDADNKPIPLANLRPGVNAAVTVGPPDPNAGVFEPVAVRIQLVNPLRPPPPRADILTGNLVRVIGPGPGQADPHVQLAGPAAVVAPETQFTDENGENVPRNQLQQGSFVFIVTRPPEFGKVLPVAVEVILVDEVPEDKIDTEPAIEERVEGFVLDIDEERKFLILEGEILDLDEDVFVFDFQGNLIEIDDLESGDLLEIDTRPDGMGGIIAVNLQVIDPALKILQRPGVIIGSLEEIDEDELVLAGPFFQVTADAEIKGDGGIAIELGDLEEGDFVRLSTSPPRLDRGEVLPVAFKVRVATPPRPKGEEPIEFDGVMRILSAFPEDGDVGIPTRTEVEVTFNAPVFDVFFDPDFEFVVFPEPEDFGDLEISADGRTLSAEVKLAKDQVYQLVVITGDTGLFSVNFSTGESISAASITGVLNLPEELPKQARFVPDESFALLLEVTEIDFSELDEDSPELEDLIVAATPLTGPEFTFKNIAPGSYLLAAFAGFELGRDEFFELEATIDEPFQVGENEEVTIQLALELPPALEVVSIEPAAKSTGVDLETELVIEFNRPAYLDEESILIFPFPEDFGELEANDDYTVFTLPLELAEDTIYRVILEDAEDEEGGGLAESVTTTFTTNERFGVTGTVSGRLVLPQLPGAHSFDGPIFVGLVRLSDVDIDDFGFDSFDEEDIAASTIVFGPDFVIEDVRPGTYLATAFAVVDVPKGFRPPNPEVRPMEDFDVRGERFGEQVLEEFDTIELFGYATREGLTRAPARVSVGDENVQIFLRGEGKTRKEILSIDGVTIDGQALDLKADLLSVEAGDVEVGVTFNKGLRVDRNFVSIEAGLNGRFLRDLEVQDEGKTILFPVTLEEEQFYKLSVFFAEAKDGSILDRPLDIGFSTGAEEIAFGSIAGSVTLATLSEEGEALTGDDADLIDAAKVFLFEEDEDEELALVSVAELAKDGSFSLDGVLPGSYQVFAELETASGQEINAIYDTDDDGLADLVEVGDGASLTGIDIAASVVVATQKDETTGVTTKTKPSGGNAEAVLTIDMDGTAGDQSLTTLTNVDVGAEVSIDVHVSGATDVSGFAAKLTYDADILDFVSATDQVSGVTNFLRTGNGTALFLSPLLREPELEYGGAILGATETTAPDGAGFLARLNFKVKAEFEGAQVTLNEVKLKSTKGEDVITSSLSAKLAPPVFTEQKKEVVSFDFNTARKDQEEFHKGFVTAGSQVEMDVYLNLDKIGSDFTDLSNYSVTVEFDTKQLSYVSYSPSTSAESNLLDTKGGTVLPLPAIVGDNSVTFGNAILAPTADTAPDSSGLIGRLTFSTTSDFSETDLLVTKYAYKSVSGSQQEVSSIIIARMSTGEITKVAAGGSGGDNGGGVADAAGADFDGDGSVGFGDFFRFADAFGKPAEGDAATFDLDKSGTVDFGDFFVFADLFGKSASKRVVGEALPVVEGLVLTSASDSDELLLSLRSEELLVRGYGAVVEYDASAFELVSVSDASSVLRQGGESLLLQEAGVGQVLLLGSATGGSAADEGLLAELHFAPLSPEAVGLFRVREGVVRSSDDQVGQLASVAPIEGRWVPQVFALHANYPNPFNPSTTIRYQLPHSGLVRLEVFDVLGQKVRTLVADAQPAGVHRLVWDSRNDAGHLVGAGVYLYRLRAGEFTQVRKLLLLK